MNNEIVTSAGRTGIERRSYERVYATLREPVERTGRIIDLHAKMQRLAATYPSRYSRTVLRAIVSTGILQELHQQTPNELEVALRLDQHDGPESWLVILAKNGNERAQTIVPRAQMQAETAELLQARTACTALPPGYESTNVLGPVYHEQLANNLWGTTFEWNIDQVRRLGSRIMQSANPNIDPASRQVWFSCTGPQTTGTYAVDIASAAMAERLDMQGFNKTVRIVESTEWRTRRLSPDQPRGLIVPTLAALHADILSDIPDALIVAECNFATHAERAGSAVGMVIPSRQYAPQILTRNVAVADGTNHTGYRDFSFMTLPLPGGELC